MLNIRACAARLERLGRLANGSGVGDGFKPSPTDGDLFMLEITGCGVETFPGVSGAGLLEVMTPTHFFASQHEWL